MLEDRNYSTAVVVEVVILSEEAIVIYTWVVYSVVVQIISVFGIVTNTINIICFIKQGFRDSVNISLLGLSVSDLCSLVTLIALCLGFSPGVLATDLPFAPEEVSYLVGGMPHLSFARVSSCITAMITMERSLCIIAPLKVKDIITPKRAAFVTVSVFTIIFFSATPMFVVARFSMKFSAKRNRTVFGVVFIEDRESIETISFIINNFVIPFGAFVIIVICTVILSFKLREATKWRQSTSTGTQVDKVSSRNQKVAKMIVMISSLFIVCFIPLCIDTLAVAFVPGLSIQGKYINIGIVIFGLAYITEGINSSVNIFIYYKMSTKYRDTFNAIFRGGKLRLQAKESNDLKEF